PAFVPQVWEDVVADCLAKDRSQRPQSGGDVAQRLQLSPTQTTGGLKKGPKTKRLFVAGITVLSTILLAALYFTASTQRPKTVPQKALIPEKSIAVLPFENRSEDQANAYFADGIQVEILTRLSKIADLKVISRTSTQHYKSAPENVAEIAKQLGVAHILKG